MQGALFYQGPDIQINAGQSTRFRLTFDNVLTEAQAHAIAASNYAMGLVGELKPVGAAVYDFVFTPWGVEMSQNIAEAVEQKARSVGASIKEFAVDPVLDRAPSAGLTVFKATWPILLGLALILGITYEVKK